MNVFEAIGFGIVVLGTGLFVASVIILAAVGAAWIKRCYQRGLKSIEEDISNGQLTDQIIFGQRRKELGMER